MQIKLQNIFCYGQMSDIAVIGQLGDYSLFLQTNLEHIDRQGMLCNLWNDLQRRNLFSQSTMQTWIIYSLMCRMYLCVDVFVCLDVFVCVGVFVYVGCICVWMYLCVWVYCVCRMYLCGCICGCFVWVYLCVDVFVCRMYLCV